MKRTSQEHVKIFCAKVSLGEKLFSGECLRGSVRLVLGRFIRAASKARPAMSILITTVILTTIIILSITLNCTHIECNIVTTWKNWGIDSII